MNILVTGGTGFIGKAFINHFKQYHYTVLTRSRDAATANLPSNVDIITTLSELKNLDNYDAVINLAGEPIIDKRWNTRQKKVICQSRWQITQQLVDLFAGSKYPPKVFISGSAIGVYGDQNTTALSETTPIIEGDFATTLCIKWEHIAEQAMPYTRVVMLRTGIVLAANNGALAKMILPFKCFLGGPLGSGSQYMSWIHYQDHIKAINTLLTSQDLKGAFNLVSPNAVTNKDFTQTLAKSLKRIAIMPMPKKVLQLLLGESSSLLLGSQNVIPEKLLRNGFKFSYPNLDKALAHLIE